MTTECNRHRKTKRRTDRPRNEAILSLYTRCARTQYTARVRQALDIASSRKAHQTIPSRDEVSHAASSILFASLFPRSRMYPQPLTFPTRRNAQLRNNSPTEPSLLQGVQASSAYICPKSDKQPCNLLHLPTSHNSQPCRRHTHTYTQTLYAMRRITDGLAKGAMLRLTGQRRTRQ
jgi:hypothetical protein